MSKDYAAENENDNQPQLDSRFRLPKKAYRLRCKKVDFKKSKSKKDDNGNEIGMNPMLERTWEIIAPEKVRIKLPNSDDTEERVVAGIEVKDWLTLTAKTKRIVKADSERLGVDIPDDELPNVAQYIGKEMSAIIQTNVVNQVDEETGEHIMDSKGNPVVAYQHQMGEKLN